jgi:hypothetical protein
MLIPGTHMIPAGNGRLELACSMARDDKPRARVLKWEKEKQRRLDGLARRR